MKYRFTIINLIEEKINYTFLLKFLMIFSICISIPFAANTQSLTCQSRLNVSLNSDCKFVVNASTMLTGTSSTGLGVLLEDKKGIPFPDDTLRFEHLGQLISVKVIDSSSTNSCWGQIFVEDKKAPTIACTPVNISCLDMDDHKPIAKDNCDPNVKVIQIGGSTTLADCDDANNILKTIERVYVAEDNNGFQSESCTQTISVRRINTMDIVDPDEMTLECNGDFPLDENGYPHPDTTGIPMLITPSGNLPLWPNINSQCKARMTYSDFVLGKDSSKEKIMRTWTFFDACSGADAYTFTQRIYIIDTEAPNIECPANITLIGTSTNGSIYSHGNKNTCEIEVNVPSVNVTDNCSEIQFISAIVIGEIIRYPIGNRVVAETGDTILYTASDGTNIDSCKTILEVKDSSPPIAVCDKHSVIGLTDNGTVEVVASVFDDGSLDGCGIDSMLISRVEVSECNSLDTEFGPTITFCCADVGTEVGATLRVFDGSGSYSDCDIKVEIQNKSRSVSLCPPSDSIDCNLPLDFTDLSQFGTAIPTSECSIELSEIDPVVNLNSCSNGTILRRWVANSGTDIVCEQSIKVKNPFKFDFENIEDIITIPSDVDTTSDCSTLSLIPENLPESAQAPQIVQDNICDLIGISYKDERFTFANNESCMKIIRTWTILNWCKSDGENVLEYVQTIKVRDSLPPSIILDTISEDPFCTSINNCEEGLVTLTAKATDKCTRELMAVVRIDINNDGNFGNAIPISVELDGDTSIVNFQYNYPTGTHNVRFEFTDACGLTSSKSQVITLQNCKKPTCIMKNLNTHLLDMEEGIMSCIWASDFDHKSTPNCPTSNLSFYFDEDLTELTRCFDCDDVGDNLITIYVVDDFNNVVDCEQTISITAPTNLGCNTSSGAEDDNSDTQIISGFITNHNGGNVPDAMVALSNTEYEHKMSNIIGQYAFSDVASNKDYTVQVGKDDDHMNGVSTLDLVLIQKHILGIEILDDPYNMIAADINKSGSISAIDLVELRKLIFGEQNSFTSNTSWRFVDKTYEFQNPLNPLAEIFAEQYEITNLSNDMKVDFVGVKVGDVSGNASFENLMVSEARSNKTLQLFQEEQLSTGSNIMELEISADEFSQVYGFQTTFSFDASALEYIGVEGDAIEVTSNNVGRRYVDKGLISLSWSSPEEVTVSDKVLFKFIFQVKGEVQQGLKINSQITTSEVYFASEVSTNIVLRDKIGNLILDQNVPNPWFDQTEITFEVAESVEVKFTVYDLFGKQIHVETMYANNANNKILLDRKDITSAGIYFYELTSGSQKVINKMIVIE